MNFTKKQIANMKNSSISLQEVGADEVLNVIGTHVIEGINLKLSGTSETKGMVGYMVTDMGYIYSTVSDTVIDAFDDIEEIIADEGVCPVKVMKRKSKGGRDFLSLSFV